MQISLVSRMQLLRPGEDIFYAVTTNVVVVLSKALLDSFSSLWRTASGAYYDLQGLAKYIPFLTASPTKSLKPQFACFLPVSRRFSTDSHWIITGKQRILPRQSHTWNLQIRHGLKFREHFTESYWKITVYNWKRRKLTGDAKGYDTGLLQGRPVVKSCCDEDARGTNATWTA